MKHLYLILFFVVGTIKAQNVNLVPNPSFEDTVTCQLGYAFPYLKNWYNPTQCSPDLYHICIDNFAPSAINDFKRHTGYGRVGLIVYDSTNGNVKEYISVSLKDTLSVAKAYCLGLYVIPAKTFKYGSDKLSVFFGNGTQSYSVNCGLIPQTPQLNLPTGTMLNDTADWYHFQGTYTSTGSETDIIIGSFAPDAQTNFQVIDSTSNTKMSYLVIDDVSLHEMSINAGNDAVVCPQNVIATIGETNLDTAFKSYYWYNAGGALIDSVHAQIQVQPTLNTFYVQEKRMCGQSLFDTVYVNVDTVCPIGIPEITVATNEIKLYPNPANGNFSIEIPGKEGKARVIVYNTLGAIVRTYQKELKADDTSMQIKDLPGGLYVVKVSLNSTLIAVKKVIVESD